MVSICKRPIEYASKLSTFLQDDIKILAMLAQVKPLLEQSTCFGKLNSAMYSQGGRRRLKKYEENERDVFGLDRPKATWGFNIGIQFSAIGVARSASIGFIVANCGCAFWPDENKYYHTFGRTRQKLRWKHERTEIFCKEEYSNVCFLPDKMGRCPENTAPCKNQGVIWHWSKGTEFTVAASDFISFGLSKIGVGISIDAGLSFDIASKECFWKRGVEIGVGAGISIPGTVFGVQTGVSVRMACRDNGEPESANSLNCTRQYSEMLFPGNQRYCATTVYISFGASLGLDYFLKWVGVGLVDASLTLSLPHSWSSPFVGTEQAEQTIPCGGCDEMYTILGSEVVSHVHGEWNAYPFGWSCDKNHWTQFKTHKFLHNNDGHYQCVIVQSKRWLSH